MDDLYVDNPRNQTSITNLHYYHINLFYTVIDMQLQELNNILTEKIPNFSFMCRVWI
jgi:hypothetical protein